MNLRDQLQEKYNTIEAKIKELENIRSQVYKTSGQFQYNPSNSYSGVNIKTETSRKSLIDVNAFIQNKAKQYHESAAQLDLNEYPEFTWCGYTPELWLQDIKLRLSIIGMDTELNKLRELKSKIQPYLPEENKIKQLLLELQ